MIIDKQSRIPAYYQLKTFIIDKISNSEWKKDNPIPSERELSEWAKVSRMTVRQAIGELVNDGVLYKIKGKGTFIAKSKIEQKSIKSFTELLKSRGIKPVTKIINFEKGLQVYDISKKLGLELETNFYRIKRLRKASEEPIAIEEVFIPEIYCPNIERFDLTGSLYEILLEEYQYKIECINLKIDAVLPNKQEQELLNIDNKSPLLKVSGNSISNIGIELFHEISLYRSDKFSYKASIFNKQDY